MAVAAGEATLLCFFWRVEGDRAALAAELSSEWRSARAIRAEERRSSAATSPARAAPIKAFLTQPTHVCADRPYSYNCAAGSWLDCKPFKSCVGCHVSCAIPYMPPLNS